MPDGRRPLTADTWQRVCTVLDRVYDSGPAAREAILEAACREQGLSVDDVKPFLDAGDRSAALPEDIPVELIESVFDDITHASAASRLDAGQRLGPYEIAASIGVGGMGEVYQANDTRLDRTVAIKVLRPHLLQSADSRQRFDREARAISKLNHPHVCTLYDIGHQDGVDFLVMEYVEGATLHERLKRGAIPAAQAIRFGAQIADALARAHRHGIVHRDLKPANIMLTRGGIKLLDFGLAQLDVAAADDRRLIGTPQYMSPEQLQRRPADARSDIFACGAVLYEMVSGRRAFPGSSHASVIAAILERDPTPVGRLVSDAPAGLEWAISRCLAKDPDDRWQNAADLEHHLDWIGAAMAPARETRRLRRSAVWIVAAVVMVLTGTWAWSGRTAGSPPAATSMFTIDPPAGTAFDLTHAISPDGRRIAFTTVQGNSPRELWIRSLDSLTSQHVPGSTRATYPFWSPDSRFVGFVADDKLKKFDVTSGTVHVIGDSPGASGASWNRDDVILFSSSLGTATGGAGLWRLSAAGGPRTLVTPREAGRRYAWPQFLPDGQRFLFTHPREAEARVYLGRLDSAFAPAAVTPPGVAAVVLAGDALFFLADSTLMAQRFDATRMTPVGDPVRVAENVHATVPGLAGFHASSGVVTYRASATAPLTQLTWLNRSGKEVGHLGGPAPTFLVSISPDGRSVFATQRDRERGRETGTVVRIDVDTGASTPMFTNANAAIWSPDGSQTVFTHFGTGPPAIRRATMDGRVPPRPFLDLARPTHATDWSRDGRFIVGAARHADTSWDIWIADAEGREPWRYLVRGPDEQRNARISPDGQWMAYEGADGRGIRDVYVQSFPDGGGLRRVSTRGGRSPRWRSDGRELYYVEPGGRMMRVSIAAGSEPAPGAPELMFEHAALASNDDTVPYDVTPDATRFLIPVRTSDAQPSTPIVVLLNWRFPAAR